MRVEGIKKVGEEKELRSRGVSGRNVSGVVEK